MARSEDSVRLEADYWRAMLDDADGLNAAVAAAAGALAPGILAVVNRASALSLAPEQAGADRANLEVLETVLGAMGDALDHLQGAQGRLRGLGELALGRARALHLEAHGEPLEGGSHEEVS